MEEKRGFQSYTSIAILLGFNLFAIIGLLFFGWSSSMLLLTYWCESAIIGVFTILKISKAGKIGSIPKGIRFNKRRLDLKQMGKSGTILFFIYHFGMFMFVHLIFLLVFIFKGIGRLDTPQSSLFFLNVLAFAAVLFISHLLSYYFNYIKKEEYKEAEVGNLFWSPYKRIIPMHIAIIFSVFLFPAVLLILIKTAFDLYSHIKEHRKYTISS